MSDRDGYCEHGVYVGGVGIDWMCGRCEDGTPYCERCGFEYQDGKCGCPVCPTCDGTETVVVAGPDENGMYDADDCPACRAPVPRWRLEAGESPWWLVLHGSVVMAQFKSKGRAEDYLRSVAA